MNAQNYKKLYPKAFDFCERLKIGVKISKSLRTLKKMFYIYTLLVCWYVSLYPIIVQTAVLIQPNFFCGTSHMTLGKVYGLSTFKEFLFINFLNSKSKMSAKPPKILIIENSPSIKNEKKHKSLFGFSSQRLMMF